MQTSKKIASSVIINIKNLKYFCDCNNDICFCNEFLKYKEKNDIKKITKNKSNINYDYLYNQWNK